MNWGIMSWDMMNATAIRQNDFQWDDPAEVDANRFAAHLLMPEQIVHAMIRVRGIHSVEELARLFGVSRAAMRFRPKELGYAVA